ncbi:hypothetical protein NL676_000203 [Syzygium grande]|nr:hypothetical protein NL676_000203 [Syzygium grande]
MVGHTITLAEHHTACQGDELLIQAELCCEHPIVSNPSQVADRDQVKPHRRPVVQSIGVPSPSRTEHHPHSRPRGRESVRHPARDSIL